jgi:metallo-beta-lactamase class B
LKRLAGWSAIVLAACLGVAVAAQDDETLAGRTVPAVVNYSRPVAWPNENKAAVASYLSQARKDAGPGLFDAMAFRCLYSPGFPRMVSGMQYNGFIEPTRVFDNLYDVGQNSVSSWALVTGGGIILFDTLNNEDEAKNIIVPNLIKVGLDPKDIKYIVITHEHGDHYGGARYLQKTYAAHVIASSLTWENMAKQVALPIPDRDMVSTDGEQLKLGEETLTFYLTPGHTPGTQSILFKVTERGVPHMAGLFGGTGGGRTEPDMRTDIKSLERWRGLTRTAGVDVLIAVHHTHDDGVAKDEVVRNLKPGDTNPFVVGRDTYQRYLLVQQDCMRLQLARHGASE